MNTQQIRKLPGAKRDFPSVKAKIDNRKPATLAKPVSTATKRADQNLDKIQLPTHSAKADVTPRMQKVGFGYRGFGMTSITAAIPKHEIMRPLAVHQNKKIHPRDWNSSPKSKLSSTKTTSVTDLKPGPFKAKPVPRSHYDEPFRPVLTSKKVMETAAVKKGKTLESTTLELVSRVLVINPIWHPDNGESAGKVITTESEKKEVSPVTVRSQPEPAEAEVQPTAENIDASTVESVPIKDDDEIPSNPEAVLDSTREAVELSSLPQEVESPLMTETATGTRRKRRHVKRRRHAESVLTRPIDSEEEPVGSELRPAVEDVGSTAWATSKAFLSGFGSVVGLRRTKTPYYIPDKLAKRDHKKHQHHQKHQHREHREKQQQHRKSHY